MKTNMNKFLGREIKDKKNIEHWMDYYSLMMYAGECDPAFPMLNYICDRFELNMEQRYWLAFLYGTNYCGPTVYYIYNEFPDYENVNISRMEKWWSINKGKTFFQTDRAKVKNFDFFTKIVESYSQLVGSSQEDRISSCKSYQELYDFASSIYYFGRFSIFNYTQALWELTNTRFEPTFFNLKEAESCRNGLCYAVERIEYIKKFNPKAKIDYEYLQKHLDLLIKKTKKRFPNIPVNIWNVETALCAFKKLFWGTRYFGYYIDRQLGEIKLLSKLVTEGVNWGPLYEFRYEYFPHALLGELNGWDDVQKNRMFIFKNTRSFGEPAIEKKYKQKVIFERSGECYEI